MGTIEKINEYVGKKAVVSLGGLEVNVKITDYKVTYGRERFQVIPLNGEGQIWIEKVYGVQDVDNSVA